jgi:electron transfer flavoprotein-quinone oxidoreductase
MTSSQYDVAVVGAGAAGLTAAIGLARAGFAVAAVEAAPYPGAENWSGCVYFAENLAAPEILGPEGVDGLAWERRLVERGFFATDGHGLLGMTYRDPQAFRHCYTVLRPVYDHHLAQLARRHGVALLSETTAESLIRDRNRVIGIATNRGPLYADLVFLAEGDASHLVTREGYERYPDQRETPKFLHGIKQVIELPPGAIEEIFRVGPEEGVAYELLVRNGTLRGRQVHLNMGGFVYANRQSLSLGLVLPASNLHEHFGGDPNLLLEWFEQLPALEPWLKEGRRGVFGAKLIRGGGAKDIPRLIDDGLAIGGAASAVGIDFPYPNFTGPATAMGLLLVRAACRIRSDGGRFTQDALRRHYLEPLQQTHYWHDVQFLRHWPGYVKRTPVFFGRNIDLVLGSAYIWTRPRRWFLTKWFNWLRLMWHVGGPGHWGELRTDLRYLLRALNVREVMGRPALGRLCLDGTVNALRDLFGSPRPDLPAAGRVQVHYHVAGSREPAGLPPRMMQRWFRRFAPVLASAARRVYANDDQPLQEKLHSSIRLLLKQVNMLDLLTMSLLTLFAVLCGALQLGWDRLARWLLPWRKGPRGLYPRYAAAARQAADLTPHLASAARNWEGRLGKLAYHTVRQSHIHLLWPQALEKKTQLSAEGLWHVCPARVYELRLNDQGQQQVVVNFENCIKCETCWRTSSLADWARDGQQRFVYPVHTPAAGRLLAAAHAAGLARPALPRRLDPWEELVRRLAERLNTEHPVRFNGQDAAELAQVQRLLDQLEQKLIEFDQALAEEPRTIDRARAEYLEMLARYAQQLATRIVELLRASPLADSGYPGVAQAHQELVELSAALLAKAEERARRAWDQHFSWAAADGRQMRQHHVAGLRCLLRLLTGQGPASAAPRRDGPPAPPLPLYRTAATRDRWLRAEENAELMAERLRQWAERLDAGFGAQGWRELERQGSLSSEQDAVLRDLLAQVPPLDANDLAGTLHPPERKALLAELGRRDPSLAFRAASHLWARDLARLAMASSAPLADASQRWTRGDEWAAFAVSDQLDSRPETYLVPARDARRLLLLVGERLVLAEKGQPGLTIEPVATLGLRGAGLARVAVDPNVLVGSAVTVDPDRLRRAWSVLSSADLTSIAFGMADQLCNRAVAHAASRVQFPGLFHDEEARDTIGKFGAVKKMLAEMAARRYVIETLDQDLAAADFSSPSVERAGLIKALAAELLGTAPGSVSYNAGQVFGGTGYSEDDILSKFFRDAAAWRFLGVANAEIYRQHGRELLRSWRPDGQRLAAFPDEAERFDQLIQRKALQAELDEVRVARSRLRGHVQEMEQFKARLLESAAADSLSQVVKASQPQLFEELARQNAHLLASKALLLRTHARLENGLPAQTETALVRVWLEQASLALEEFDGLVRRWLDSARRRDDRPVVEPGVGPPARRYSDYLQADCRHDSGDFLFTPVDLVRPRLVPELIESDPELAQRHAEIRQLMIAQFGPREGRPYERYIEQRHRPDAADLDFCRRHGFFRMPIPRDLGGEGRSKLDYYLVTTSAQRLADVAMSLTIQANTSIGTTPVLLARDKDLPRAQKELGAFVGDPSLASEVRKKLEALLKLFAYPEPRRIEQAYLALQRRLEEAVLSRTVLKVLAHRFGECWQRAGRAGRAFDLAAMRAHLEEALSHWQAACGRAAELFDELGRRRQACDLFLRWVASGQISAFALTEPSAGSDTARIATRAVLRSVPVEPWSEAAGQPALDGVYRFVPAGATRPRVLLDAGRLEFRPDGVYFRWSETVEPAPIRFNEYDYETDDPRRLRYFEAGGRKVHFHDIAQLRRRDGRPWYDYWELTGAKMWITNARMAGIMCLYAKTEEGVIGFIVDRHAEGLVVGKDEAKMGQCGSPTNELSLQAVRVPRENVIGLEGRGQVNALETLNVGRAGLAMSAMAQMQGLIDSSRHFAQDRAGQGQLPDWVKWRLERMEEDRFTAEALAFEVIGRFEHPHTRSVRLESAISKMLVSELLHRIIEHAEDIHGLAGQTQLHLVEKRKRDARILNIYEGTNEVQRFFILKDLVTEVAPRWPAGASPPQHAGREAVELEALKSAFRQRLESARALFGDELWRNPNLQANCFLLAEAAAWIKAADSTLARLAWRWRHAELETLADEAREAVLAGLQRPHAAFRRCLAEVELRLRRFDEELTHLRRGYYAPEVRAASLLLRQAGEPGRAPPARRPSHVSRPLAVLVVVEPTPAAVPQPFFSADGRLLEAHWTLTDADASALETALRLKDAASAPVSIQVAAVGPKGAAQALRGPLALGVDRCRLVLSEAEAVSPASAAAALAAVLRPAARFDLILGGAGSPGDEGVLARLTAEALGVDCAGSADALTLRWNDQEADAELSSSDGPRRIRPLPLAVLIEPSVPLRPFTTGGYLASLVRSVEAERWPKRVPPRPLVFAAGTEPAPQAEEAPRPLDPAGAAHQLLHELGLGGESAAPLTTYEGAIEDITQPAFAADTAVAIVAADADGRLSASASAVVHASHQLSPAAGLEPAILLLVPADEPAQRRAVARLRDWSSAALVLLHLGDEAAGASVELRSRLLADAWRAANLQPRLLLAEPWAESAVARLAERAGGPMEVALRVRQVEVGDDRLVLETSRAGGKLRARQTLPLPLENPCWLSLAADAAIRAAGWSRPPLPVQRWSPRLERTFGQAEWQRLLEEVRQETGLARLADADFIIDVGFGVGNRDGYDAVIVPLEKTLRQLGVRSLAIGGSRKATEELHLLPADRQIGQSGVSVNPRILLAIGISGAPQHLNYIGARAVILAFNRDPEAPLLTLNRRQPRPRVFPILGDLFDTVPAFCTALRSEQPAQPDVTVPDLPVEAAQSNAPPESVT